MQGSYMGGMQQPNPMMMQQQNMMMQQNQMQQQNMMGGGMGMGSIKKIIIKIISFLSMIRCILSTAAVSEHGAATFIS